MPHKKIYVETDRYGNPQWILKRSSSCREERRANITESELRELRHQNEELVATNVNLSTSVQAIKVDLDRQTGLANHWYREAQGLVAANRDLRVALENCNREGDRETRSLRLKYTATKNALDEQKNENRSLITRLREKIELIGRLEEKVASLKQRYQDALDNFASARAANARFSDDNARLRVENGRLRDENGRLREDIAYLRRSGFL